MKTVYLMVLFVVLIATGRGIGKPSYAPSTSNTAKQKAVDNCPSARFFATTKLKLAACRSPIRVASCERDYKSCLDDAMSRFEFAYIRLFKKYSDVWDERFGPECEWLASNHTDSIGVVLPSPGITTISPDCKKHLAEEKRRHSKKVADAKAAGQKRRKTGKTHKEEDFEDSGDEDLIFDVVASAGEGQPAPHVEDEFIKATWPQIVEFFEDGCRNRNLGFACAAVSYRTTEILKLKTLASEQALHAIDLGRLRDLRDRMSLISQLDTKEFRVFEDMIFDRAFWSLNSVPWHKNSKMIAAMKKGCQWGDLANTCSYLRDLKIMNRQK